MHSRFVTAATLLAVCAAAPASAQSAKLFQNSWFWGVHGGATHIGMTGASGVSGSFGAEWMLTRSIGGLYLAFDQTDFNRTSAVADPNEPSGYRAVDIHDMRTGSIGGMAFPVQWGNFRPYAGVGVTLNVIDRATPQVDTTTLSATVAQNIEAGRSRSALFFMGGGQWQIQQMALFGQISVTQSTSDFLIDGTITRLSAGVRYNFGSSIRK